MYFILILILIFLLVIIIKNSYSNKITGGYREIVINELSGDVKYIDDLDGQEKTVSTKSKYYIGPDSNKQIAAILKYGNVDNYARLISLIGKYINIPGYGKILEVNKMLKLKDNEIYSKINASKDQDIRGEYQSSEIYRYMIGNKTLSNYIKENKGEFKYLDLGCGNGKITENLARYFNTKPYCFEVNKNLTNSGVNYSYGTGTTMPFGDGYFNIITAFMVLHHITENTEEVVKELYRITKPGGFLFIKEHDVWDAFDAMLVDIEHFIYIYNTPEAQEYKILYKNYFGWDSVITKYFKYIFGQNYSHTLKNTVSPTRAFYGIYQKII